MYFETVIQDENKKFISAIVISNDISAVKRNFAHWRYSCAEIAAAAASNGIKIIHI